MIEISANRCLPGGFILQPDGGGCGSAIVVLGGSEGGDHVARGRGTAFVADGYTVVGLPYYASRGTGDNSRFADLPRAFANLPIELVGKAIDWCEAETGISAARTAIYGFSKGAELALLAATMAIEVAAVVAIAPSDVAWEGWGPGVRPGCESSFSWHGMGLPFVPYVGFSEELAKYACGGPDARLATPHERGRLARPDRVAAASIPVELCHAPMLLAAGELDRAWPSALMARSVALRREAAGLPTDLLILPDCGHSLCGGGGWLNPTSPTGAADQRGQRLVWQRTRTFLTTHLGGHPD